ncbi:MAG: protein kinase [Candidatus Wallbacteria bacterium]|nr:protein kinase [Candidatus Wallbacteria bacterium]
MAKLEDLSDRTIAEERTLNESERTLSDPQTQPDKKISAFRSYRVLELLPASGAEADIYKVTKSGRDFILKLYRYGNTPNTEALRKIMEISRKFPGDVIHVFESEFDEESRRYFEIMEYVRFGSLKDLMADRDYFTHDRMLELVPALMKGLKTLHSNNLLHLDLKPSNILVRNRSPLELIYTDFGVSSVIDDEISRKMTMNLKGTPMYWSPEAFTQVVGRESDFWSVGVIILEILKGRHPLHGLDMRNIMYSLSTKGLEVPGDLPKAYQQLLKGLLTRNPGRRWSFAEVERWLSGGTEIPVFFDFKPEFREFQSPISFNGKDFSSLEELLHAFILDEESWIEGRELIAGGSLEEWLRRNGEYDYCITIEKLRKMARNDKDYMLVKITLAYLKGTGFVFYGKLISFENVFLFASRVLSGNFSHGELCIVKALMSGALLNYYKDYLRAIQKDEDRDEFHQLLSVMRSEHAKESFESSLAGLLQIFDFWWKPEEYYFPADCSIHEKVVFLREHAGCMMKKKDFLLLREQYFIPMEMVEGLQSGELQLVHNYLQELKRLREERLLVEREKVGPNVVTLKEYQEFGKLCKNRVDISLYLIIPSLLKSLSSPRFFRYEFCKLSQYLKSLRQAEIEWSKYDKRLLRELEDVLQAPRFADVKLHELLITGLMSAFLFLELQYLLKPLFPESIQAESGLNAGLILLAAGIGLFSGAYKWVDSLEGERMVSFGKGFFLGASLSLLFLFLLKWTVPGTSMFVTAASGFVFGFAICYLIYDYYGAKKIARIYEDYLYRILAVEAQNKSDRLSDRKR